VELTSYKVPGDKSTDIIVDAKHNGRQVKVWRVEVDERAKKTETVDTQQVDVYPAMFGYGVVDSLDITDGDSFSELDYTINILGKLVNGTFPLSADQVKALGSLYDYERPGEKEGEFASTPATPAP